MTLPWYPFFWSDYGSKTMHLTQGQHGAYMLFLRWVYTTGAPIPNKQRFSIARATLDQERSDATVILEQFFERRGQNWHSLKAEKVMKDADNKHFKYVEAGRLGGQKKASVARAMPEHPSTNHNYTHNTEERKKVVSFSFGNGGGRRGVEMTPENRLSFFHNWLAPLLGSEGWVVIAKAMDPEAAEYQQAVDICRAVARQNGKGWPHQWPKRAAAE